ncbi:armadillo repeat [Trichoderma arundinaceum]|uniref:Armadillo repeat n=1 Tax=Trichoderma arundinaceum TaxID=490622 RepID=A0A395NJR5_TRIAR|nr:armadillo repeat [Trichoderma arundinaceum]
MARPQASPILAQLRNAKTCPEQSAALQALKNEIVGHHQKKEAWVSLGVLEPVVRTLTSARSTTKANANKDARPQLPGRRPLSEEDNVRLQALQIITSFAKGMRFSPVTLGFLSHSGPPFLPAVHASRALPAILACTSPNANAPQIVVAALKAVAGIADAADLASPSSALDILALADTIFTSPYHLESLCLILATTSSSRLQQNQVELAAALISHICRDERHQQALVHSGVLDMLSSRLASFAVSQGHVVPGAEAQAYSDGLYEAFPKEAPQGTQIGPILGAVAAILGDSKYRAIRLINSPAILAVFPSIAFEANGLSGSKIQSPTAMDYLLPPVPPPVSTTRSPPNSHHHSSANTPDHPESRTPSQTPGPRFVSPAALESSLDSSSDDIESPFIPWLILQARALRGYGRLMAATILTSLFKAGLGRKGWRETSLGMLIVPILIDLIAKNDRDDPESQNSFDETQHLILERAPATLARLITDSEQLQKAAYECGAVKTLTKLLRRAYRSVPILEAAKYWSPQPDTDMDVEGPSAASQLGQAGQDPLLSHRVRLRESTLKAIGAVASGKEDYRKALVDEDFIPYVMESLNEYPKRPKQIKDRLKDKPSGEPEVLPSVSSGYGANPLSVIVAACHVIRMLSRSISILRTTLVDHSVAMPVFKFLKHPDVDVQVAATAAICNLVLEASPVRELLAENGVMKILCEHAHSHNPALRLNALWALKHFVIAVSPELKRSCLEHLEAEWLVQLIYDDGQDTTSYNTQPIQSPGDDVDEEMDASPDEQVRWMFAANGNLQKLDASRSTKLRQAEDKLASIRESELNSFRRSRSDDVAVQEQGLELVRNLVGLGAGASAESPYDTTEMIDYLFSTIGQERLFEILSSKLRAKVLHPFSRRSTTPGQETRLIHPHAKIIIPVIYILVHIAASTHQHRQLVVGQTELLKLLCQQISNRDKEVRVAVCHLIINLTGQDDEGEGQAWSLRAMELKKLGFYNRMEFLKHNDRDLDVRERARTAVYQLERAIAF